MFEELGDLLYGRSRCKFLDILETPKFVYIYYIWTKSHPASNAKFNHYWLEKCSWGEIKVGCGKWRYFKLF